MKNKQKVADIINIEDIKNWKYGEGIMIDAPTGSGKSYFIQNVLYEYAKQNKERILFLSNRNILKFQIQDDISHHEDDVIEIMNYQKLESLSLKNSITLGYYDYIVADECHYFFTDATFNNKTDLTLNLLKECKYSKVIFMSATPYLTKSYFKEIIKNTYTIEQDYSYMENLYFYKDNETIEKMLKELPNDEKAIYFTGAKQAYETHKLFRNSAFICSEYNKTHKKYINQEEKNNIIENERFNSQILCCTTVLDNGVNIKDKKVKHIIIGVFDLDTLQQCLGRKRIDGNEKINVYIKNWNNNSVGGIRTKTVNLIDKAMYLKKNGEEMFLEKYKKDTNSEIIDVIRDENGAKLSINQAKYIKYLYTGYQCWDILNTHKNGYKDFILKKLNIIKTETHIQDLDDSYKVLTIEDLLDDLTGKKLYKDEQNQIINAIDFRVDGRQQRSYRKLNYALREVLGLDYVIKAGYRKSYRDKEGKTCKEKSHWVIGKIVYE